MNLTKERLRTLRDDLQAILDQYTEETGFKMTLGTCRYSTVATFQLECAQVAEDGTATSKSAEDFRRYAKLYDLSPEDLGKEIVHGGQRFTLTGINPRCRRFPIQAQRKDGKQFKLPAESVARAVAAAK